MRSSQMKHPLARGLGDDWCWFHDPTVHLWVLLHESGLHVEMPCDLLWTDSGEASDHLEWSALAHCMAAAVREGKTGLRFVCPLQVDNGPGEPVVSPVLRLSRSMGNPTNSKPDWATRSL